MGSCVFQHTSHTLTMLTSEDVWVTIIGEVGSPGVTLAWAPTVREVFWSLATSEGRLLEGLEMGWEDALDKLMGDGSMVKGSLLARAVNWWAEGTVVCFLSGSRWEEHAPQMRRPQ